MIHDRVAFREPTTADIAFVAMNMRENDKREVLRWLAQSPMWALKHSVKNSDVCYAGIFEDGSVGAIFGGIRKSFCDGTGVIWQLSSTAVDNHKKEFMRATKRGIDLLMRAMSDVAEFSNWVDTSYIGALKWIEYFGGSFTMEQPQHGVVGGSFREFVVMNPYHKREE